MSELWCIRIIRSWYGAYVENWIPIPILTIATILVILSTIPTIHAFPLNNIDSIKLQLSNAQESISLNEMNIGKIILYSVVIIILAVTRFKWAKHGRKVTRRKVMIESIFFLTIGSIVLFDSFYYVGIPILYIIPYLAVFFGLQHYSFLHSNKFISFWTDSKTSSIYVKGGTHIHLAYVIGTTCRIIISILFIGSLFTPSRHGIIYIDSSTQVLATVVFDLLLMISLGLLIGINRRILVRYNLINTGREKISEK